MINKKVFTFSGLFLVLLGFALPNLRADGYSFDIHGYENIDLDALGLREYTDISARGLVYWSKNSDTAKLKLDLFVKDEVKENNTNDQYYPKSQGSISVSIEKDLRVINAQSANPEMSFSGFVSSLYTVKYLGKSDVFASDIPVKIKINVDLPSGRLNGNVELTPVDHAYHNGSSVRNPEYEKFLVGVIGSLKSFTGVNGDFNNDGCFNSADLVIAFQNPSLLDMNGDGETSDDLVRLFQEGHYEQCN